MERTVYIRGTRRDVHRALAQVQRAASGNSTGARLAQRALLCRLGLVAQARIKAAFIVKSKGGMDEAGEKWVPLSPYTIAYRRRHPGVPKARQRAKQRPSWNLTQGQKERWWKLYSQALGWYKGDRSHAAAHAWRILKAEGATTLMEQYGQTKVLILRDTGLLLNSLSPGVDPDSAPTTVPHKRHQIFRVGRGEVIVGTNRKGARDNHEGRPRLPQRRLWPEPSKWPRNWWTDLLEQARQGVIDIALWFLQRR